MENFWTKALKKKRKERKTRTEKAYAPAVFLSFISFLFFFDEDAFYIALYYDSELYRIQPIETFNIAFLISEPVIFGTLKFHILGL